MISCGIRYSWNPTPAKERELGRWDIQIFWIMGEIFQWIWWRGELIFFINIRESDSNMIGAGLSRIARLEARRAAQLPKPSLHSTTQCTDLLVWSFWIRYWFWCDVAFCLFSDIWCFITLRLTLLRSWFWRCFTVSKAILERWWSDSYWNKNENNGNCHTYAF